MRRDALWLAVLGLTLPTAVCRADPSGGADESSLAPPASDAAAGARAHFAQALALYRRGRYRGALAELDEALRLDPQGKDLVYNLALVREKLADYDGAIEAFRKLASMERDPIEIERAEQAIARLEGARDEQRASLALVAPPPRAAQPLAVSPAPPRCQRGRYDGFVLGAGIASAAAALLGTIYGVRALSLDPSGESTGPGQSFQDLRARAVRAHRAALVADISFGVSLAAGVAGATLYFGRSALAESPARHVSGAWLRLSF
jgi:tetratricopeptide (TPR) repeat protein